MKSLLPSPSTLGFDPTHFPSYRSTQERMIFDVTESRCRIRVTGAPTGTGKSLAAMSIALLEQARTLILTSRLLLQDVYADDGESIGAIAIKGAKNYRCPALEPTGDYAHLRGGGPATADRGPCKSGMSCKLRAGGCPQYDQIAKAQSAEIVIANYDYWLAIGKSLRREDAEEQLGEFDYIICDESHASGEHIAKTMHLDLELGAVRALLDFEPLAITATVDEWRRWADAARMRASRLIDNLNAEVKLSHSDGQTGVELLEELKKLRALDRTFVEMSEMYGKWVVERSSNGRFVGFDPVWVDRYVEQKLFRGIPNVVLMSATIRPAALRYLGIADDQFDFFEYPSPFPVERRPIYVWPLVRMHWKMGEGDKRKWADGIDRILDARLDRNSIAHAVSYKRMREFAELSRHRKILMTHDRWTTEKVVEQFKRKSVSPPACLVSPSVGTGFDFPLTECETVIVMKVPYPSTESLVMQAKMETDKEFSKVYASEQIVQFVGRPMRSSVDRGEAIIVDQGFGGLMKGEGWRNFPAYFRAALKWVKEPPRPLAKLR